MMISPASRFATGRCELLQNEVTRVKFLTLNIKTLRELILLQL